MDATSAEETNPHTIQDRRIAKLEQEVHELKEWRQLWSEMLDDDEYKRDVMKKHPQ